MKGSRSNTRTSSRSYLGYGLIIGVFLILLTYFTLSNQFVSYTSKVAKGNDAVRVIQIPSGKDDSLKEKPSNPKEESFELVNTFEEPEVVVKGQEKSEQDESIDRNKTILLGNESEQEQEKIEETEQTNEIKNGEDTQKRDVIEVQPTEKERKQETENGDDTQKINVTEYKEETPIRDVIKVELPNNSKNPGEPQENLEKEKLKKGLNQFNNGEQTDQHQVKQFDGFLNLGQPQPSKQLCDQSDGKFDLCDLNGDARTIGSASVVLLIPPNNNTPTQEYKIKPYSRKYLENIKPVTVKSLEGPTDAPPCSGRVNYPGIVIALGGLSGNYWHDFTDILIPLYIRSRQFNKEVQFLVTNNQPWWIGKYENIFKALSRYEIINFDQDYEVRCYPRVLVSYGSYKEFSIDPSRAPNNYTMVDFTKFLRRVYHLEREFPTKLGKTPGKKPRLMIISRGGSRKFVNMPDIVQLGERLGFEVTVIDPKPDIGLADFARTVNSFDVMLGVHGAGLTNCLFLPPNAVLIQVVPYGKVEHLAKLDFGDPAVDMNLNYIEYSITVEESTLLDTFGRDHEMIRDPLAIHQRDWGLVAEWYLGKQDIKLDIHRFEPILWQALGFLQ
ncbi:EGF domain-specific O-linked [Carex littledalei]|uniref:EGF domain-specific O-linked n=1 Tax=Carex littledalei TaxID=544730 RepID=A0A833QU66_9POAL|nr:EGF domain-specific O-linked [Carex littledalei]